MDSSIPLHPDYKNHPHKGGVKTVQELTNLIHTPPSLIRRDQGSDAQSGANDAAQPAFGDRNRGHAASRGAPTWLPLRGETDLLTGLASLQSVNRWRYQRFRPLAPEIG